MSREEVKSGIRPVKTGKTYGSSSTETVEAFVESGALARHPTQVDDEPVGMDLECSRVRSTIEENFVHRVLTADNTRYTTPMPRMGDFKPLPEMIKDRSQYRVEFTEEDPMFPLNWDWKRKAVITGILTYSTTMVSMASSVWGPILPSIMEEFNVGLSVAALGTSLYVLGFAGGPLLWGPLSEYFGRRVIMLSTMFLCACFAFAVATGENFQTLMICRFFSGLFGASTMSLVPAVFADMYPPAVRGKITGLYAFAVMGGPCLGPVISGFLVNSYLGWRWPLYIPAIAIASATFFAAIFLEETFSPIVLVAKATELRERTGNWAIYANHETVSLDFRQLVQGSVLRPIKMLVHEPILMLLSLYAGFVYGLLYMCLTSIPIIYKGYGWKGGVVELPYLSLFLGCVLSAMATAYYYAPQYLKVLQRTGKRVVPEARLPSMMVAGPIFALGIFWMCWSGAYPRTAEHPHGCHWMIPVVGMALFGYGFLGVFLSITNYLVDSYMMLSASASAANVCMRSLFGAGFPLFSTQMFRNLGIQWAGTLIGCIAVLMIPVPFLFYLYGPRIRSMSKYAVNLDEVESRAG